MAKLYVKSPNNTVTNIDLNKSFTIDGGAINGNICVIGEINGHYRADIEPKLFFIGNNLPDYDRFTEIAGSDSWEHGGALFVYGSNYLNGYVNAGGFSISACNGTRHPSLTW